MDFQNNIQVIEATIGYTFRDKSLLRQAFTRASYCNEGHGDHQSNEVLEFFGDSALSLAIVTNFIEKKTERYRYGIRTDLTEGDLSNMRSRLTDKKNLSDVIKKLDLEKYLIVGNGDAKLDVKSEKSVREDLCEAIIGAVYIDSGFSVPVIIAVTERMIYLITLRYPPPHKRARRIFFRSGARIKNADSPHPRMKKWRKAAPITIKDIPPFAWLGAKRSVGQRQGALRMQRQRRQRWRLSPSA